MWEAKRLYLQNKTKHPFKLYIYEERNKKQP